MHKSPNTASVANLMAANPPLDAAAIFAQSEIFGRVRGVADLADLVASDPEVDDGFRAASTTRSSGKRELPEEDDNVRESMDTQRVCAFERARARLVAARSSA
jgi:hypothetical protein